jgi:hypothetical protein
VAGGPQTYDRSACAPPAPAPQQARNQPGPAPAQRGAAQCHQASGQSAPTRAGDDSHHGPGAKLALVLAAQRLDAAG